MENQDINFCKALEALFDVTSTRLLRRAKRYSFGSREECEKIFYQAFSYIDKSVIEIQHLSEYSEVIDWMTDTKGKGLLLTGDCGRGKTTIAYGVIPLIFQYFKSVTLYPVQAQDIHRKIEKLIPEEDMFSRYGYVIDDVGTESIATDFGNRYEPVMRLINEAEAKLMLLVITTNLSPEELLRRYDVRTMDRIARLCKTIKFKGKSLRK